MGNWTKEELTQFHKLAGKSFDVDYGMTDEGDPWIALCTKKAGEVFAHFAKVDGRFILICLDKKFYDMTLRGLLQRFQLILLGRQLPKRTDTPESAKKLV